MLNWYWWEKCIGRMLLWAKKHYTICLRWKYSNYLIAIERERDSVVNMIGKFISTIIYNWVNICESVFIDIFDYNHLNIDFVPSIFTIVFYFNLQMFKHFVFNIQQHTKLYWLLIDENYFNKFSRNQEQLIGKIVT